MLGGWFSWALSGSNLKLNFTVLKLHSALFVIIESRNEASPAHKTPNLFI